MKGFLLTWLVNIAAMIAVINFVPGIHSETRLATVTAALVLGLLNATLRPLVIALTLPVMVLSFGIFTLFVNGFFFYLVSKIVDGFIIDNFRSAFWGAFWFSIIGFFLNLFVSPQGRFRVYRYEGRQPPRRHHDDNIIDVEAEVEDDDKEKDGTE